MLRALAITSTFLLLVGFQDTTYSLKEKPVLGAESSYKITMKMEAPELNVSVTFDTMQKVTKIEDDGAFELEYKVSNSKTTVNGEELPPEDESTETYKYDKDGKKIKKEEETDEETDPMSDVLDVAMNFEPKAPVKSGDTWEIESDFGKLSLKLTGTRKEDGIDVLVISVSGTLDKKDVSAEVRGIHLVRVSDFSVQKSEVTLSNAKFAADSEPGKVELTAERKS